MTSGSRLLHRTMSVSMVQLQLEYVWVIMAHIATKGHTDKDMDCHIGPS